MGFLGGILGGIGKFAGSIFGGAANSAANSIGSGIGSMVGNKVFGVPQPGDASGGQFNGLEQGTQANAYYNAAFPGTTPWERLGTSSPMGGIASSIIGAKNQNEMQQKDLQNKKDLQSMEMLNRLQVAHENNRATAIGAGSPYGVQGAKAMVDILENRPAESYDTPTKLQRERLPSEIQADKTRGMPSKIVDDVTKAIDLVGQIGPTVIGVMQRKKLLGDLENRREQAVSAAEKQRVGEMRKVKRTVTVSPGVNLN